MRTSSSRFVAWLLLAVMLSSSMATGVAAQGGGNGYVPFTASYTVDVNVGGWHATGIDVRGGASISATGEASCDIDASGGIYFDCFNRGPEGDADRLMDGYNAWSLLGRIGDTGEIVVITNDARVLAGTGELQVRYNDNVFGDNGGEYVVTATSCRPGNGVGDANHCHLGAPGQG